MPGMNACAGKMYRTRDPEASPFFALVCDYFDEFEQIYPEQFQKQYGFLRPVICESIDKFLKCGDLKEGFVRVRCPECGTEFFVAFSCRQRSCCFSCDQKGTLPVVIDADVRPNIKVQCPRQTNPFRCVPAWFYHPHKKTHPWCEECGNLHWRF